MNTQLASEIREGKILVIDDESMIRDNLQTLLLHSGYRVFTAPNGSAALELLEREVFDLIITDIMMEGADGFRILEYVRKNSPHSLVTVITGYASMDSTIRAMRMGAFDYIVKPFDFELLSISIERAMRKIEADHEKERAEEEVARWSAQLAVINDITKRAATILDETELLRMVSRAVHREFGYYHVYFTMLDEDKSHITIEAQAGAYEGKMPEGYEYEAHTGITGKVIATGKRLLANDVKRDRDYFSLMPATRSQVALPVKVDGQTAGVLSVESADLGAFDERDVTLLETLAEQVASFIKTIRLFQKMKETNDFLEAVITSSADAIVTTDTHGIINSFSPGAESIYGYAAHEVIGKPVSRYYDKGVAEAEKVQQLLLKYERLKNHSTVMLAKDGRKVYASISASLLKEPSGRIMGTLGISKDITQRVELERKLKELTITDSLTGLYNQRYLYRKVHAEIERARRQGRSLTLLLLDLNKFKQYNDTYGHLEGDKLLREVGRLLLYSIRSNVDGAFRYGGDEFVVLLPEIGHTSADAVAGRIKSTVEQGLGGKLSLSMGVALLGPDTDAEALIRLADGAMYEAKKSGGTRIVTRRPG